MGHVTRALIATAGVLAALSMGQQSFGLRFNRSASMPIGFWVVADSGKRLVRNDVVVFCSTLGRGPWNDRRVCRAPLLMKPIVAIDGDVVELGPEGLAINGVPIGGTSPTAYAADGAIPFGVYRVAKDEFWVLANSHPRSFDSRYFGPIARDQIQGVAKPLLLWGENSSPK